MSTEVKKYRDVLDLAQHMYDEGLRRHPDGNFWFYHDALSLLCSAETRNELEKRGILKHWILPENGLNAGTVFALRPTGNRPEYMPWDTSLNKCLIDAVMYHVAIT